MADMTLTETIEVQARLVVEVGEHGIRRPATPDDLRRLGWMRREDVHDRVVDFMFRVDLEPHGDHTTLRAFVEDACGASELEVLACLNWSSIQKRYHELLKGATDE